MWFWGLSKTPQSFVNSSSVVTAEVHVHVTIQCCILMAHRFKFSLTRCSPWQFFTHRGSTRYLTKLPGSLSKCFWDWQSSCYSSGGLTYRTLNDYKLLGLSRPFFYILRVYSIKVILERAFWLLLGTSYDILLENCKLGTNYNLFASVKMQCRKNFM